MARKPSDVLFSEAARNMQSLEGTNKYIDLLIERDYWKNQLSDEQMKFIKNRDSFYFATSSADGSPYLQHRGGNKGFIQVPNPSSLWFPDFGGNKQYISAGNLSENNKAFLFFMDYPNQRRLKLWGTASILDRNDYPLDSSQLPERGDVERIIHFNIEAIDENCRQHILKRFTDEEYQNKLIRAEQEIITLKEKIKTLEK